MFLGMDSFPLPTELFRCKPTVTKSRTTFIMWIGLCYYFLHFSLLYLMTTLFQNLIWNRNSSSTLFRPFPLRRNATARRFLYAESYWTQQLSNFLYVINTLFLFIISIPKALFSWGTVPFPWGREGERPHWGDRRQWIFFFLIFFSSPGDAIGLFSQMKKSYIIIIRYYNYYNQRSSDFTSSTFWRLMSITFCKDNNTQLVELLNSMAFLDLEGCLGARILWEKLLLV